MRKSWKFGKCLDAETRNSPDRKEGALSLGMEEEKRQGQPLLTCADLILEALVREEIEATLQQLPFSKFDQFCRTTAPTSAASPWSRYAGTLATSTRSSSRIDRQEID